MFWCHHQYLAAEWLELSGNEARDRRAKLISPGDIANATKKDEELQLLQVSPMCHSPWDAKVIVSSRSIVG